MEKVKEVSGSTQLPWRSELIDGTPCRPRVFPVAKWSTVRDVAVHACSARTTKRNGKRVSLIHVTWCTHTYTNVHVHALTHERYITRDTRERHADSNGPRLVSSDTSCLFNWPGWSGFAGDFTVNVGVGVAICAGNLRVVRFTLSLFGSLFLFHSPPYCLPFSFSTCGPHLSRSHYFYALSFSLSPSASDSIVSGLPLWSVLWGFWLYRLHSSAWYWPDRRTPAVTLYGLLSVYRTIELFP